jgi:hypothetical protein
MDSYGEYLQVRGASVKGQRSMANKIQNGMQGVFLTAAELTHRGFIVSLTSRNAFGADLLVTDNQCQRPWSVQVKTNQSVAASFWLLSAHCENLNSDSHIYVFVGLKGNQRPQFLVVPSSVVAANVCKERTKSGVWYSFACGTKWDHKEEGWEEAFGNPTPALVPEEHPEAAQSA